MKKSAKIFMGIAILVIVIFVCGGVYAFDMMYTGHATKVSTGEAVSSTSTSTGTTTAVQPEQPKVVEHLPMPEEVRGIYVSSYSFMSKTFQAKLDKMLETTTINAIVVDIKDAPGTILFDIGYDTPCVNPLLSKTDLEDRLAYYRSKGIYTIARIAVFRDACFSKQRPDLAVKDLQGNPWRDTKGNYWLSPHQADTRVYIKNIAKAVYDRGFDEVQFDYVRYPSDGNMKNLAYEYVPGLSATTTPTMKRRQSLKDFFQYMRSELAGIPISADVFGMVLTNNDDLTIGQHLDDIAPYVDALSGMIYPSHFPKLWNGIQDTHTHPYETVHDSSEMGLNRMSVMFGSSTARKLSRPWLQDFSIFGVVYNAPEVKAQIKALDDLGIHNFLLWNASNRYTSGVLTK